MFPFFQLQTNNIATMLIFTCVRAFHASQFGMQRLREDTELNISKTFQVNIRASCGTRSICSAEPAPEQ